MTLTNSGVFIMVRDLTRLIQNFTAGLIYFDTLEDGTGLQSLRREWLTCTVLKDHHF